MSTTEGYTTVYGITYEWGTIYKGNDQMCQTIFEVYLRPDQEKFGQFVDIITQQVIKIVAAARFDLLNDHRGFQVTLYNPTTHNYLYINAGEAYKTNIQNRQYYIADSGTLRIDGILSDDQNTSYMYIVTPAFSIRISPSHIWLCADNQQALETAPDLSILITAEAEKIAGTAVNPYEIIYGGMSDAQLFRAYLGPDTIVDPDLKKVVVKQEGSLKELSYEETLRTARDIFRRKIWTNDPGSLPRRMKQARPEGIE